MVFLSIFRVLGHSMEPNLKNNRTVIVSSIPYLFKSPKIGEIVVFKDKKSGKLILKRIKKINGFKFIVVGDNRKDSKDFAFIERSQIVGKLIFNV